METKVERRERGTAHGLVPLTYSVEKKAKERYAELAKLAGKTGTAFFDAVVDQIGRSLSRDPAAPKVERRERGTAHELVPLTYDVDSTAKDRFAALAKHAGLTGAVLFELVVDEIDRRGELPPDSVWLQDFKRRRAERMSARTKEPPIAAA